MAPIQSSPLRPLTAKEKAVLEFIESYIQREGIAPSFQEIKDHFGFASFNSVQRYLKQLQHKDYIHIPEGNQKRAITVLKSAQAVQLQTLERTQSSSSALSSQPFNHPPVEGAPFLPAESLSLPLYGRVAAGQPLEAFEHDEHVDVPASLLRQPAKSFVLKVEGQSMIEDGILNGDLIIVQQQPHANNGDIVVGTVDNESTVKRFYLHEDKIELRPANSSMTSLWFSPEQVKIQGVVVGLIRRF